MDEDPDWLLYGASEGQRRRVQEWLDEEDLDWAADEPLEYLREKAAAARQAMTELDQAVAAVRRGGLETMSDGELSQPLSWADIGQALGISRQGAWERYRGAGEGERGAA